MLVTPMVAFFHGPTALVQRAFDGEKPCVARPPSRQGLLPFLEGVSVRMRGAAFVQIIELGNYGFKSAFITFWRLRPTQ